MSFTPRMKPCWRAFLAFVVTTYAPKVPRKAKIATIIVVKLESVNFSIDNKIAIEFEQSCYLRLLSSPRANAKIINATKGGVINELQNDKSVMINVSSPVKRIESAMNEKNLSLSHASIVTGQKWSYHFWSWINNLSPIRITGK